MRMAMTWWNGFLDWFDRHKVGVIGTMMLHTMVVFLLAIADLRTVPEAFVPAELEIEAMPVPEEEQQDPADPSSQLHTPVMSQEVKSLSSNVTATLKATRLSAQAQQRITESVEQDLQELERSEFERLKAERSARGEDITMPTLDPSKWDPKRYMEKAAEPVKVEGPTAVWHDLKDRIRENEVPGYLCPSSGRVAVRVLVDLSGNVTKAELDAAQSANADECMIEQALRSSRMARFNHHPGSPDPQKGTIYFVFLAQ